MLFKIRKEGLGMWRKQSRAECYSQAGQWWFEFTR